MDVALVGIGLRLPGGCSDKDAFFRFLEAKGDAMRPPPEDRWNHAKFYSPDRECPGKSVAPLGGWLTDVHMFDPLEFGVSQHEANASDPSLRLCLEVAHAALRDSGIAYAGTNMGVYVGQLLFSLPEVVHDIHSIKSHWGYGKTIALRANRISYAFDLTGPSMVIDTACSASGTAMHVALNAIAAGEIDHALVIGASTNFNPEGNLGFSKMHILSPEGSSKSFDAAADGYARSEGFTAVVIKKLAKAERDGDRIYCVIAGSSISANGRGRSMTMPEPEAQKRLVLDAYRRARRDPGDAFYVELHSTGTPVGDPAEANAIGEVFTQYKSRHEHGSGYLRVGSVKSNIGHTEGSSFLASLIKVALILYRKQLVPNIRFVNPNPAIRFDDFKLRVQTENEQLEPHMAAADGRYVASISSYGIGGANCHAVVTSYAPSAHQAQQDSAVEEEDIPFPLLFVIGTRSQKSLRELTQRVIQAYGNCASRKTLRFLAYQLCRQARNYPHKCLAVAHDLGTAKFVDQPLVPPVRSDIKYRHANGIHTSVCLVFGGQGPQHNNMGRQLSWKYPAYRNSIRQSDRYFILHNKSAVDITGSFTAMTGLFDMSCREPKIMLPSNGDWPVQFVVLSLVFYQIAMVDLVKSLGLRIDVVIGHSLGEIAMGYASGHLTHEMAIKIAIARAAAMKHVENNGAMAALACSSLKAQRCLQAIPMAATDRIFVAASNSPRAVTVAGAPATVDSFVADVKSHGVQAKRLRVTCAFHTELMTPARPSFLAHLERFSSDSAAEGSNFGWSRLPDQERVPVISTVTGSWLDRSFDAEYCWDNIRKPVLFRESIEFCLREHGHNVVFVEVSPHPVLKGYVEECGAEVCVPVGRRPSPQQKEAMDGVCLEAKTLYEGFGKILAFSNYDHNVINLRQLYCLPDLLPVDDIPHPDYPYQKIPCVPPEDPTARFHRLGNSNSWQNFRLNALTHPWLDIYRIAGVRLIPTAGYIAGLLMSGVHTISDFTVLEPLIIPDEQAVPKYVHLAVKEDGWELMSNGIAPDLPADCDQNGIIFRTVHARGTYSTATDLNVKAELNGSLPLLPKPEDSKGDKLRLLGSEYYGLFPDIYHFQGKHSKPLEWIEYNSFTQALTASIAPFSDFSNNTPVECVEEQAIVRALEAVLQSGFIAQLDGETKKLFFPRVLIPKGCFQICVKIAPAELQLLRERLVIHGRLAEWCGDGFSVNCVLMEEATNRILVELRGVRYSPVNAAHTQLSSTVSAYSLSWQGIEDDAERSAVPGIVPISQDATGRFQSYDEQMDPCNMIPFEGHEEVVSAKPAIMLFEKEIMPSTEQQEFARSYLKQRGGLIEPYLKVGSGSELLVPRLTPVIKEEILGGRRFSGATFIIAGGRPCMSHHLAWELAQLGSKKIVLCNREAAATSGGHFSAAALGPRLNTLGCTLDVMSDLSTLNGFQCSTLASEGAGGVIWLSELASCCEHLDTESSSVCEEPMFLPHQLETLGWPIVEVQFVQSSDSLFFSMANEAANRSILYMTEGLACPLCDTVNRTRSQQMSIRALCKFLVEFMPDCPQTCVITSEGTEDIKTVHGLFAQRQGAATDAKNELRQAILSTCAECLGIPETSLSESSPLVSCGLDSLAASRLSWLLEMKHNLLVPQIQLLDHITVEDLCRIHTENEEGSGSGLRSQHSNGIQSAVNDAVARCGQHTAPACPFEESIWMAQEMENNTAYQEAYLFTIATKGSVLDSQKLSAAVRSMCDRHGSLRTTLVWDDDEECLTQITHASSEFQLDIVDLSDTPNAEEKARRACLDTNSEVLFELESLPIAKGTLYRVSTEKWLLHLVIHHVAIDHVSLDIMFKDIARLYADQSLPALEYQYGDFSVGEGSHSESLEFWKKHLRGSRPLIMSLPGPAGTPDVSSNHLRVNILTASFARFEQECQKHRMTKFAGYFTVFNVLLHQLSESAQGDFVVGSPFSQRTLAEFENTVGYFVNMLPVRVYLQPELTFLDHVADLRDILAGIMLHSAVPFQMIVDRARDADRSLFRHVFVFSGDRSADFVQDMETAFEASVRFECLPPPDGKFPFLLHLDIALGTITAEFDPALFSPARVAALTDRFVQLVARLGDDWNTPIGDLFNRGAVGR
ncbi:hypothetical protein HDU85_001257 [Gaertneriomyces sp. JEL0708]|nr:hypothetical protein HDU85_001257 [Gaertneriomyces sp. JEL0708]